ncbi:MAG: hypothetical protein PHD56_00645 [Anaerostipes sp.]|nr:hypothetical protein [Anaerostipes sp.]
MNPNSNLKLEQAKLQKKYSSYYQDDYFEEEPTSYWSFFKLRITFSIILILAVFASTQTMPSKETKQIQTIVQSMKSQDAYTKSILNKINEYNAK